MKGYAMYVITIIAQPFIHFFLHSFIPSAFSSFLPSFLLSIAL